ncbi:MAG: hypothetical protein IPO98_21975 [Saprospiraceae bacterium]|nr:hypothetical protein [Saprospiraceae bacterium]
MDSEVSGRYIGGEEARSDAFEHNLIYEEMYVKGFLQFHVNIHRIDRRYRG